MEKWLRAVLVNGYCANCLAHEHSGKSVSVTEIIRHMRESTPLHDLGSEVCRSVIKSTMTPEFRQEVYLKMDPHLNHRKHRTLVDELFEQLT